MNSSADITGCLNHTYFKMELLERYCLYAFYFVFTILVIFGNSLSWYAFLITEKLRTPANYFLLNLSAADLLFSLVVIGLLSLNEVEHFRMMKFGLPCLIIIGGNICVIIGSILSILGIAVERYISVFYPLHHLRMVTPRRAFISLICIWCTAIIIATPLFNWNTLSEDKPCDIRIVNYFHLGILICPIIVLCLFIASILYLHIFYIAMKQTRKMADLLKSVSNAHLNDLEAMESKSKRAKSEKITNENKVTKMAGMVIGLLFITWLPIIFITLIKECNQSKAHHYLSRFMELLNYSNAFMNPIIYQCRSETFRLAFKKILSIRIIH